VAGNAERMTLGGGGGVGWWRSDYLTRVSEAHSRPQNTRTETKL